MNVVKVVRSDCFTEFYVVDCEAERLVKNCGTDEDMAYRYCEAVNSSRKKDNKGLVIVLWLAFVFALGAMAGIGSIFAIEVIM